MPIPPLPRTPLIATIALVALAAGGIGYWLGTQKPPLATNNTSSPSPTESVSPNSNASNSPLTENSAPTSPSPISMQNWKTFSSTALSISLKYPPTYTSSTSIDDSISVNGRQVVTKEATISSGGSTAPFIHISATPDKSILTTLQADHPLQTVSIGGKSFERFQKNGEGSPYGYVINHNNTYYVIEFDYGPDEATAKAIVGTLQFL